MKCCVLKVDDRIFCREAVLKASYLFVDNYYIHLSYQSDHIIAIAIESKKGDDISGIDREFGNELIAQMVHFQLSVLNKGLNELILGRALFSTCLEKDSVPEDQEESDVFFPSLDDIAVDWFEKYETDSSL